MTFFINFKKTYFNKQIFTKKIGSKFLIFVSCQNFLYWSQISKVVGKFLKKPNMWGTLDKTYPNKIPPPPLEDTKKKISLILSTTTNFLNIKITLNYLRWNFSNSMPNWMIKKKSRMVCFMIELNFWYLIIVLTFFIEFFTPLCPVIFIFRFVKTC